MVWVIIVLYLIELVLITQESIHEDTQLVDEGPLMSNYYFTRMMFDYMFYVSFLTPSFNLVVLCYIPGIIIAMGINIFQSNIGDFSLVMAELKLLPYAYIPIGLILFVILQKRELKRFMTEQAALSKEAVAQEKQQQVAEVLNSQSDAIIVVRKTKTKTSSNSDPEQPSGEEDPPEFLFCNRKSVQLFGFDLADHARNVENNRHV